MIRASHDDQGKGVDTPRYQFLWRGGKVDEVLRPKTADPQRSTCSTSCRSEGEGVAGSLPWFFVGNIWWSRWASPTLCHCCAMGLFLLALTSSTMAAVSDTGDHVEWHAHPRVKTTEADVLELLKVTRETLQRGLDNLVIRGEIAPFERAMTDVDGNLGAFIDARHVDPDGRPQKLWNTRLLDLQAHVNVLGDLSRMKDAPAEVAFDALDEMIHRISGTISGLPLADQHFIVDKDFLFSRSLDYGGLMLPELLRQELDDVLQGEVALPVNQHGLQSRRRHLETAVKERPDDSQTPYFKENIQRIDTLLRHPGRARQFIEDLLLPAEAQLNRNYIIATVEDVFGLKLPAEVGEKLQILSYLPKKPENEILESQRDGRKVLIWAAMGAERAWAATAAYREAIGDRFDILDQAYNHFATHGNGEDLEQLRKVVNDVRRSMDVLHDIHLPTGSVYSRRSGLGAEHVVADQILLGTLRDGVDGALREAEDALARNDASGVFKAVAQWQSRLLWAKAEWAGASQRLQTIYPKADGTDLSHDELRMLAWVQGTRRL